MKGQGSFLLSRIPCDEQGKAFLALFRKHLNRNEFDVRVRGNGSRVEAARKAGLNARSFDQSLPLSLAEHVRVYVTPKQKPPVPIRNVPALGASLEAARRNSGRCPSVHDFARRATDYDRPTAPVAITDHLTDGQRAAGLGYHYESAPSQDAAFRNAHAVEVAKRMTDQAKSDMAVLHAINEELRSANARLHAENADLHARYAELLFGTSLWVRIRNAFVRIIGGAAHGKD